jgi:hypothetical protein
MQLSKSHKILVLLTSDPSIASNPTHPQLNLPTHPKLLIKNHLILKPINPADNIKPPTPILPAAKAGLKDLKTIHSPGKIAV